jgi:hypothetical protein
MGEMRNAYNSLLVKPEGKRLLGRPRRRREYNIRMDLRENRVGCCALDKSASVQGPVTGSCEHGNELQVSYKARNLLTT